MISVYNSQTHQWEKAEIKKYQGGSWKILPVYTNLNNLWTPAFRISGTFGWKYYFSTGVSERTDDCDKLPQIAPRPYNPNLTAVPYSPFDFAYPWCDIQPLASTAYYGIGELVIIPKFYYKWTITSDYIQLQISSTAQSGFLTSPAHADRGGGIEGDQVYVGRYLCAGGSDDSTAYRTIKTYNGISSFGQKQRNSAIFGYDFALHYTIAMLCLVEFGTWNPHTIIGAGYGNSGQTGATKTMPYHTGVTANDRIQYRYIEDLWCEGGQFTNGARRVAYDVDNDCPLYSTINPINYYRLENAYLTWGTKVLNSTPTVYGTKYVDGFEFPSLSSYAYFPNPTSLVSSSDTFGIPYSVRYIESAGSDLTSDEIYIMGYASDDDDYNKSIYGMQGFTYNQLTSEGAHRRWQVIPHAPRS